MAHNQSALSVLSQEVLTDPDLTHSDVFRRMLQAGLQDLINAEASARIGAAPHERTRYLVCGSVVPGSASCRGHDGLPLSNQ